MANSKCVDVTTAKCNLVDTLLKREHSIDYGIECYDEVYMGEISKASSFIWVQNSGCDLSKEVCCILDDYNSVLKLNTWECPVYDNYICDTVKDCSVRTIEEIFDIKCSLPARALQDLGTGLTVPKTTESVTPPTDDSNPPEPEIIIQYISIPSGIQSVIKTVNLVANSTYTISTGFKTVLNVFVNDSEGESLNSGIEVSIRNNGIIDLLSGTSMTGVVVNVIGLY